RTLYYNNGYIYMQPRAEVIRRTGADGKPVVDLRWSINEGQPAIVNKIEISGNDVTHERVIRDAIILLPGDVFRQDALIRSYQNISNLGFFQQPLPFPDTRPANDQGDVDVIFRVTEKHTGNINFGASVGQGTGVGGFLGLDEPNLFGQGKKGHFQWQFGKNISDFAVTYTDLAIPTAGTMHSIGISQSGGPLGGSGNFQRLDLEGRWYAPLGQLGGAASASPVRFVMGLSTRSGLLFGNSPFFDQLFTMGGVQYGIPLRGYDEFSITPRGYDPTASNGGE